MERVGLFHQRVYEKYGRHIASEFIRLMREWDGGLDVSNAFYDDDLLDMKLKEAQEKF